MAPLSGLLGFAGEYFLSRYSTEFYRFFGLSWETSSHSRVLFTIDYLLYMYVFFSENRPPEELDNKRSSARRLSEPSPIKKRE